MTFLFCPHPLKKVTFLFFPSLMWLAVPLFGFSLSDRRNLIYPPIPILQSLFSSFP